MIVLLSESMDLLVSVSLDEAVTVPVLVVKPAPLVNWLLLVGIVGVPDRSE